MWWNSSSMCSTLMFVCFRVKSWLLDNDSADNANSHILKYGDDLIATADLPFIQVISADLKVKEKVLNIVV